MYNTKTSQLIRQRSSCRTYRQQPLAEGDLKGLETFIDRCGTGPLGNSPRFKIVPASSYDSRRLPHLGTYGFTKDPAAFIIGMILDQPGALEDLGFCLELLVLKATELEIGSCWLGATFTKNPFARQIELLPDESIPAVVSLGYPSDRKAWLDRAARVVAGADHRKPWQELFFSQSWTQPLTKDEAGAFREPLQLLRLAPSASNKQPWRVLEVSGQWHFYLQRTPNYPPRVFGQLLDIADLQRIDMGIALAHFQLGVEEAGLGGIWHAAGPKIDCPGKSIEYIISWKPDRE